MSRPVVKPSGLILLVSVAANVVCAAITVLHPETEPAALRRPLPAHAPGAGTGDGALVQATRAGGAQTTRYWSVLASPDLRRLIANLRAAGFPPALVRAMALAQLDERLGAAARARQPAPADRPFWKLTPAWDAQERAAEYQASRERIQAMRALFADPFFANDDAVEEEGDYRRWQYGAISRAKMDLLERINLDYGDMIQHVRQAMDQVPLPADRDMLALLEREKRADLAAVLTPGELEEYELRSSPITARLRESMTLMDATEAEFRAVFALQQQVEQKYDGSDFMARNEAEMAMIDQLKPLIGEARAADFARARDQGFVELARLAERNGLPSDAAVGAYDLRNRTAAESIRILNDSTRGYGQRLAALRSLAANTAAQLQALLGPTAGAEYAGSATWLKAIASGSGVEFRGAVTSFPQLHRPAPRQ